MIRGIDHIGMSVADLDRAIAFYRDLMCMELMVKDAFGGTADDIFAVGPGAKGRYALLRFGKTDIEMFEFSHPQPKTTDGQRPVCDHGLTHIGIEVDDIDAEYARLTAAGVRFHCPPRRFEGPIAAATYGRDPEGNVFEIFERSKNVTGA